MTLLVCGSRTYSNARVMEQIIRQLNPDTIIQGGASGADELAITIAEKLGIFCETYEADWKRFGKRAGYLRNKRMLDQGKPDMVVAFYDGWKTKGTAMMIRLAKEALVLVKEYGLKGKTQRKDMQYYEGEPEVNEDEQLRELLEIFNDGIGRTVDLG